MEKITIVQDQLKRMRQMNRYYHHQFLIDVRLLLAISVLLLVVENSIKYYLTKVNKQYVLHICNPSNDKINIINALMAYKMQLFS